MGTTLEDAAKNAAVNALTNVVGTFIDAKTLVERQTKQHIKPALACSDTGWASVGLVAAAPCMGVEFGHMSEPRSHRIGLHIGPGNHMGPKIPQKYVKNAL